MERGERNRKKIVINKEYWDMKNEKKMANKYLITKVRIKRDNRNTTKK